jgi:hypothetical protein
MTSLSSDAKELSTWKNHPFYRDALVLAVDVGLSYIGVHVRLGDRALVGETAVCGLAPTLSARRLARHARRNRWRVGVRPFVSHWSHSINFYACGIMRSDETCPRFAGKQS